MGTIVYFDQDVKCANTALDTTIELGTTGYAGNGPQLFWHSAIIASSCPTKMPRNSAMPPKASLTTLDMIMPSLPIYLGD